MRVHVDLARCEAHGECEMVAPEVFRLDAQDQMHYETAPPEALRAQVEKAVRTCPAQAISVDG